METHRDGHWRFGRFAARQLRAQQAAAGAALVRSAALALPAKEWLQAERRYPRVGLAVYTFGAPRCGLKAPEIMTSPAGI